jgi:hypothetical protein
MMNADANHPAILALFVDGALRGKQGKNSITEAQVEDAVDTTVRLLAYLAVRPAAPPPPLSPPILPPSCVAPAVPPPFHRVTPLVPQYLL